MAVIEGECVRVATVADPGRLICTPHPITLEGQTNIAADLRPGESLYTFLDRHIDLSRDTWSVAIGGVLVPVEHWPRIKPKHGQIIEVRGVAKRAALMIVALAALTYFTFGIAGAAGWGAGAAAGAFGGGFAGSLFATAVYAAGSMLINKVLGPKLESNEAAKQNPVYALSGARNRVRPYEPLGLLFGSVRIAPDVASLPYTWYEGDDQYMAMVLTPGINVDRHDALYNGDSLLSAYEGVQVYTTGYTGMPEQTLPVYTNADTVAGGELANTAAWVQRTTSADTVAIKVNIEYLIYDADPKGKPKTNTEVVQVEYRAVGSGSWSAPISRTYSNNVPDNKRATISIAVAKGQYDVRVRRLGNAIEYSNGHATFQFVTMTSVQADTATYAGFARTAIIMKATGQLNGAPDEIRGVHHAKSMPIWNGTAWATATSTANGLSNPGAQILKYARGFFDDDGKIVGGIGLPDEQIDIEALKGFTLHCVANGYTYDNWVIALRNHEDMLAAIALAGFGQITWAGGRLSVVWAADEQPASGVVNMATIKKAQFQVDYTLANAADGIEYTYFDKTTWEAKTLRVAAPGVTTMLNPAQLTGEGITSEAHAAELARYHLAQSIYQYKDIGYGTDLEHLSYQRLSVLALQHDMTQWGFGGRLVSVSVNGSGIATLTLDEPVPAPASGNAYVGLRIPGESVYRVFLVQSFSGESNTLTLAAVWPGDADVPGDVPENPAHDTIWIYDFKNTPGYRVRVVGIEPESDLKGARVSVVPEPPEFWTYVKTGTYTPPQGGSSLLTRPIASGLKVTEQQVIQGDTVFTVLSVSFDITGPVGHVVVSAALGDGQLVEVAQTSTRTATWRIADAGTYAIVVRPFNPEGHAGVAVSTSYTTLGADAPPALFDTFAVTERSGGVRAYSWGYLSTSNQPPDLAGAEIRYVAGSVPAPTWDTMTILSGDGFYPAAFESVIPVAGQWTFACRARDTGGRLSDGMRVLTVTLQHNLGEVIDGIEQEVIQTGEEVAGLLASQLLLEGALAQEVLDRQGAIADEAEARAAALLSQYNTLHSEVVNETTQRETEDENLAAAISSLAVGTGEQFDARKIWYFNQDLESWDGNGTPTVVDGWLRPADHATDAYVYSPDALGVDGSAYRYVKARIKKVGSPTWSGKLYWQTGVATWDDARSATIAAPTFDAGGVAGVQWEDAPWWPGTVNRIRLDVGTDQDASNYFLIDWVAIGRPSPGAGVALVQDEATARIAGDAAEAANRNTLAVQMRGSYTGTDITQVTQGLVHSERQARVTAISAETSARQTLAATVNHATTGLAAAHARVTSEETARVNADTALSNRTAAVEARMPAGTGQLATSSALTTLGGRVDTVEGGIQTNATAITAVKSSLSGGGNLLRNATFGTDAGGWYLEWNEANYPYGFARNHAGDSWRPNGVNAIGFHIAATTAANQHMVFAGPSVPVASGRRYCVSGYVAAHRADVAVGWILTDASGGFIAQEQPIAPVGTGGQSLTNWTRQSMFVSTVGISGAAFIRPRLWMKTRAGEFQPFAWLCMPMIEEVSDQQTAPSPWSAGGNEYATVVETMRTDIDTVTGKFNARHSVLLDVNGNVSGTISENTGTSSSFKILTSLFQLVSPGSGERLEFSNGNLRVYDANGVLRVRLGVGF